MPGIEIRRLTGETLPEINCCPGGIEVKGKSLRGDLTRALAWRKAMLAQGMAGFVAYHEGQARGFIEYMPADVAPVPVEAPGGAILMCYHWAPVKKDDEAEHHAEELRLIRRVIEEVKGAFSGLATMGWADPVHFPIPLLKKVGFKPVQTSGEIRLMWLPLHHDASPARMLPDRYHPPDLSSQGRLAIDSGWSSRCPYSIHNATRLDEVVHDLSDDVRQRVRHSSHCLDTREDVAACCFSPWNWEWTFFNGESVSIFGMPSEKIRERILTDIAKLCAAKGKESQPNAC